MSSVKSAENKDEYAFIHKKQGFKGHGAHGKQEAFLDRQPDGFVVALMFILETVNTSNTTALLKSKQMSGLAKQEEKLNKQAAGLSWEKIPTAVKNHHSDPTYHYKWIHAWVWVGRFRFWEKIRVRVKDPHTFSTTANLPTIELAEIGNQQRIGARNEIMDRLASLQQLSQVGESSINANLDQSTESTGMGSKLLDTLTDMTFKLLLTQEPQI